VRLPKPLGIAADEREEVVKDKVTSEWKI